MTPAPKGSHFCSLPASDGEAFDAAAGFLKTGLDAGHLCVFVADRHAPEEARAQLKARRIPVERFEAARQLVIVPSSATPLKAGPLDLERLLAAWREQVARALSEGFPALRVVVEMTWALDAEVAALARYEKGCAVLFEELPLHALCLYARERFAETVLEEAAVKAHPRTWLACEALGRLS